jgi:hypothetical protein
LLQCGLKSICDGFDKEPQIHYFHYWNHKINHIIKYLENILNPEIENKEPIKQTVKPKGQTTLNREQTALLFFYLREKSMIAPGTQNNTLSEALELMTGISSKQIYEILKIAQTPAYQLGKYGHKVTPNDFQEVIEKLNELTDRIKKDMKTYSDKDKFE